jgi:hypothetical protein
MQPWRRRVGRRQGVTRDSLRRRRPFINDKRRTGHNRCERVHCEPATAGAVAGWPSPSPVCPTLARLRRDSH